MPSVFTQIIDGRLPAEFVWQDKTAVAFLSINPIETGHTLVVPRVEVDHWIDLDAAVWLHCAEVAQHIGKALRQHFTPPRVATLIAGFDVPHTHIHVLQLKDLSDLSFEKAQADPDQAEMDDAAERIRTALTDAGHGEHARA